MIVELKDYKVELKDEMTWGDAQKVEDVFLSSAKLKGDKSGDMNFGFDGSVMLKAKYVAIEMMIKSIKKGDEVIEYSKEWLDNLSMSDGNKLDSAVEELTKKK